MLPDDRTKTGLVSLKKKEKKKKTYFSSVSNADNTQGNALSLLRYELDAMVSFYLSAFN